MVTAGLEIFLDLAENVDSAEDLERLSKELIVVTSQVERLEKLLDSDFAAKAPAALVEKERVRLAEFIETRDKLKSQLS